MTKEIRLYQQRRDTCAIACMLMVLEYYDFIPKATWVWEKKYDRSYRSKYMTGTPLSAVAWHFAKNGLKTKIIHSEEQFFHNQNHFLEDYTYSSAVTEYCSFLKMASQYGVEVQTGVALDSQLLEKELKEGNLVILAGQRGKFLHAVLLGDILDQKILVFDPLEKIPRWQTKEQLENFMNTPIGKWCVCVRKEKQNS